ncbi:UvrD-helicase domain-containing protein, partial [Candidatus Saccharibacteria bacterium]|nr:UvrD-helicase domain-containing protein [Candidatus Saccharibacteria bacterium]
MTFDQAYDQLNDSQKQAVNAIEGPVLVLAGPGTGKTQLLSTRVANILKKTDTDAKNILCLTFTNKAATNMRERVTSLAGNDARDVTIKTFHSFAAEIMNSYPEYFWSGANLSNAPEAVQLEIVESIIKTLPKDNPFAVLFDGNYTMVKPALSAIGLSKQAGLTPDKLRAILEINLAYIEDIEPHLVEILSQTLRYKKL